MVEWLKYSEDSLILKIDSSAIHAEIMLKFFSSVPKMLN